MKDSRFFLSIFLPAGITWEIGNQIIRTRKTVSGEIVMRARRVHGAAHTWLSAARNLSR